MGDCDRSLIPYRRGGDIHIHKIVYYVTQVMTTNNSNSTNISGNSGTVSVVQDSDNVRITNQINALTEQPETQSIANAFEELQRAINISTDLDTKTKTDLLEAISSLSTQAGKNASERSWSIRPAFEYINKTISTVSKLANIWSKWESTISTFFGIP
jgi:hypothetical protein